MLHNSFQKKFLILCLFIISVQFFSLSCLVLVPVAQAQDGGFEAMPAKLNIQIGDLPLELKTVNSAPCKCTELEKAQKPEFCKNYETLTCVEIPWIAQYIGAVYRYGVVLGSVVAVLSLMAGGLLYVLGGFNQTMIGKGKEMMTGAVMGLALLLGSYMILNLINPNLVKLGPITVAVNKEVRITRVNFCYELKASDYIFTPELKDATCGIPVSFKNKDTNIKEEGTCMASTCPDANMWCMPASKTDVEKLTCRRVRLWGYIADSDKRFLDGLYLYGRSGSNVGTELYKQDVKSGEKVYWIPFEDKVDTKKFSEVVIGIELNDTGEGAKKMAYGNVVGEYLTKATNYFGASGTMDDDYYVGRGPTQKMPDGKEFYTGVWTAPQCDNTCLTIKPKDENGWLYEVGGCNFIKDYDLSDSGSGVRVDIDARLFQEDGGIDCAKWKSVAPKPTKKVGENCGSNAECFTNDCEKEYGSQRCECNANAQCNAPEEGIGTGNVCLSSLLVWNSCQKGIAVGEDCGPGDNDEKCLSGDCECYNSGGADSCRCECNTNAHCQYGALADEKNYKKLGQAKQGISCNKGTGSWNLCTQCVEPDAEGESKKPASTNNPKQAADCCFGSIYDGKTSSCQCDDDADCSDGEYCYKDWGYCYKQKEVLELCTTQDNNECKSGSCIKDNWYDEGPEEWRCQCTKDEHCGAGKHCVKVESDCGWNYCIDKNKKVPAVPDGYGPGSSGYDAKNYPYKGLCQAPADCADKSSCIIDGGKNSCDACKGILAGSDTEGSECTKDCSGNGLLCTDSFKEYFGKQKNICVKVTSDMLKGCADDKNCVGGKWADEGFLGVNDCDDKSCDCNETADLANDGCVDGAICANNLGSFHYGNDICVDKDLYDKYWETK